MPIPNSIDVPAWKYIYKPVFLNSKQTHLTHFLFARNLIG
jgi:hypothetical protein